MKRYVVILAGLFVIVALEVILAVVRPSTGVLLPGLLVLALIEASLALLYFMHLRYERRSLTWSIVLAVVVTVVLMDHFWFDAFRLLHQRLTAP
jgi:heme/copper-type cytochrome/quinol oxidase subunit 4